MTRTLIACVGNSLAGDDAFGRRVFEKLRQTALPPDLRLEHLELGGLGLLDLLQGQQLLIVVDALRLGTPAGTLHVLPWRQLSSAAGLPVTSHDLGLREAIEIGLLLHPERMPADIFLVGVEGGCFERLGKGLSPEVEAAVGPALRRILELAAGPLRCPIDQTTDIQLEREGNTG